MVEIEKHYDVLLFYSPEDPDNSWIRRRFDSSEDAKIQKTFSFRKEDIYQEKDEGDSENNLMPDLHQNEFFFVLGHKKGDYYVIPKRILGLEYDLWLVNDPKFTINLKVFIKNGVSIFKKINWVIPQPIIIGGAGEGAIPVVEFKALVKSFPTSTTAQLFVKAQITRVLKEYFDLMPDFEEKLNTHLKHREKSIRELKTGKQPPLRDVESLYNREYQKYEYILSLLNDMLKSPGDCSEEQWGEQISQIILLLYPKYVHVIPEMKINYVTEKGKSKYKQVDFALVDFQGNIDIIEIKRPSPSMLVTVNPSYRDNYTPKRDLSGSVMQVEKYIYHLKRWGAAGEREIQRCYEDKLPEGLTVHITNPKGIIIMGRNVDLNKDQLLDLEIIKRKYMNVMDIITYDDLVMRLQALIKKFAIKGSSKG